jgi:hypothetical protein
MIALFKAPEQELTGIKAENVLRSEMVTFSLGVREVVMS